MRPVLTDAWVQRKLGEILAEKISNGIMNRAGRNELNIKHINVVNLYSPSHIRIDELEYIDATENDLKRCNVEIGDIFLTRSSLKVEGIAQANILLDEGSFVFDDHIMRIKLTDNFEPFFVKEALNHSPTKKQFMTKSKTGTMTTIGQDDIATSTLSFPIEAEQTAIGNFFRTLDDTITLHKRKLDGLKDMKKAYLQQMFPQAGERVPRVRFAGFTGEWQERKLGEMVEKQKSYSLSRDVETVEVTGYRYIHYGDIHRKRADIIVSDEQLPSIRANEYATLNQGDLVLADASEDYTGIAEPCVITHKPKENIVAGLHTIAIRPVDSDSLYLYYLFHTDAFKKYGNHVGAGLKVFGITFNNLAKFETCFPEFSEQTAIGSLFHNLDKQIDNQNQKVDQLKQLKTAYLQKMFV